MSSVDKEVRPEGPAVAVRFDQEVYIAIGKSKWEVKWLNRQMFWSELVNKLAVTTRTPETVADYKKMSKTDKDRVKDVGGFVGGTLKKGRRKAENLAHRSMITLDLDNVAIKAEDIWESIIMLDDYSVLMYSTHSHTPERPRLRLVIPLARPVLADEYQAIARMIAHDIGIDLFDDTTYQPHRLMFWPSTPADGEYIFKFQDGAILDPELVLDRYPDWKDVTYWPTSSRQSAHIDNLMRKQEDPLEKKGLIGAFCRTYGIADVIDKFLADVYVQGASEDRYTYTKGSTVGGVVTYDDKFSYSHHGTDPASSQLCNAFDLVRLHKFGGLDDDAKIDTPINRLPSMTAMSELASKDELVLATVEAETQGALMEEFGIEPLEEVDTSWVVHLERDNKGKVLATISNIVTILDMDPYLKGKISFNTFSGKAYATGEMPWDENWTGEPSEWTDSHDAGLRWYLESSRGISHKQKTDDALRIIFDKYSFHPVQDYLKGLEWDGIERLDALLIDYLGADDTPYVRMVTRKWMCGAVARILAPGIKFDYMLVLTGAQGIKKSSFLRELAKDWFTDSIQDVEGNQAVEKIMGSWIVEFGELQAFSKAESNAVKRFITSQEDRTRLAYDRRSSYLKRQCVFAGTTNKTEFLKDDTGNRRFWPVEVRKEGRKKEVFKDLPVELDQIWAEALYRWRVKKEPLYLSEKQESMAMSQQEAHREVNEKEGIILEYLNTLLPEGWNDMDIVDRRNFMSGMDVVERDGVEVRQQVSIMEIWCECFGRQKGDLRRTDSLELNAIMNSLEGWKKDNKRYWVPQYGQQRGYHRLGV